jgi:hypothetical protein
MYRIRYSPLQGTKSQSAVVADGVAEGDQGPAGGEQVDALAASLEGRGDQSQHAEGAVAPRQDLGGLAGGGDCPNLQRPHKSTHATTKWTFKRNGTPTLVDGKS